MPNIPEPSAKIATGDFDAFTDFARRVVSLPHAQIKAQIEAEKAAKRKPKIASSASGVPSKNR